MRTMVCMCVCVHLKLFLRFLYVNRQDLLAKTGYVDMNKSFHKLKYFLFNLSTTNSSFQQKRAYHYQDQKGIAKGNERIPCAYVT